MSKKGNCIMVKVLDDYCKYQINEDNEPESWDDVQAEAELVEYESKLVGWEPWKKAYRVTVDGTVYHYFVD